MLRFPYWKKLIVFFVCTMGIVYAVPNILVFPDRLNLPFGLGKKIKLGLDLQGGAHLLLEIDVEPVIERKLRDTATQSRKILRDERIEVIKLPEIQFDRSQPFGNPSVILSLKQADQAQKFRQSLLQQDQSLDITLDGNIIIVTLTKEALRIFISNIVEQSIETVRRRVDESGTSEPLIQRQGANRIVVQLPGIDDPSQIKELLGKTAQLTFQLVRTDVNILDRSSLPASVELLPEAVSDFSSGKPRLYAVEKRVYVSGDRLIDAQPSIQDNQPVVSFRFDAVGGQRFGRLTRENVGRPLAIVLDGKIISAPRIESPILGGSGIISGQFTFQEVQNLSILLRAGALPAPLTIVEERTVGPGLGQDSIRAGKIAIIVGFLLVIAFMIAAYRLFGAFASLALIINLILIVASLSILQATLTLPGIAGILLTIGMAVDSNVLIFERIREEFSGERKLIGAVEAGYQRAIITILDSNITTLLATCLLFFFGAGPIRGFAITLGFGIVASMFTSILVTRAMIAIWLFRYTPQKLPYGIRDIERDIEVGRKKNV